jgi:hypothetical protein
MVMYHPAFLLRQQHMPTKKDYYKELVSNHFNSLLSALRVSDLITTLKGEEII